MRTLSGHTQICMPTFCRGLWRNGPLTIPIPITKEPYVYCVVLSMCTWPKTFESSQHNGSPFIEGIFGGPFIEGTFRWSILRELFVVHLLRVNSMVVPLSELLVTLLWLNY